METNILRTRIYYEVLNKNISQTPVVFLHGWGGSIKSFEYFANKISMLRTCILIDFPPFGGSSSPKGVWTLDDYTFVVEKILLDLGFNSCDIVAHSFGGRVAINIASRNNIRINKLLLTASAGIKKKSLKRDFKILRYKILKSLCKLKLLNSKRLLNQGSCDYNALSSDMKKTFSNIVNFDQRNDIKKINCPTLLFWGKRDKDTPFYFTKFYKKHIKDCEVIETNGGHFTYLEHSALFLLCMQSFLT